MKNFKIILYILPLLVCLSLVKINSYAGDIPFNWGTDVLNGTNGSANINSLLGDTYSFDSLYSPGFVIGLSNAYDQLNNTLYDKFGWDLDSAGQKIIDLYGGDDLGAVLSVLSHIPNVPALDWASNGYQLYRFARSGGGQSLILGAYDSLTNTVTNIYDNMLNLVTHDDIANITTSIDELVEDDVITDFTTDKYYYGNSFSLPVYHSDGSTWGILNLNSSKLFSLYVNTNQSGQNGYYPLYFAYEQNVNMALTDFSGSLVIGNNVTSFNRIYTSSNYDERRLNNGMVFYGFAFSIANDNNRFYVRSNDISNIPYGYDNSDTVAYNYSNSLNYNRVMELLRSLEGHWVTTEDMATVRDLLDGGVITQNDTTGAIEYDFDDVIADSLADIIDSILDRSLVYEEELEGVIDDSLPDNPDPEPDKDNTGISVPPDYPTQSFDTVNDIIRSPLEFFSIFEPIFMIFGSSALIIFGLWLFVPCVIIIGFIIWALK